MKKIQSMNLEDRPREKLLKKGAQALSDIELLAVLLGSGNRKHDVFVLAGHVLKALDQRNAVLEIKDLMAISGIGAAKSGLIVAALELARRRISPQGIKISSAQDVYPIIRHFANRRQEHFLCISLNGANEVICVRTVSVGLVNRALVHPREVFADPITDRATAVIVAHNHPSGNLVPSNDDLIVTRQLKAAGETLGISLLDHIIFDQNHHYSLADQGQV